MNRLLIYDSKYIHTTKELELPQFPKVQCMQMELNI